MARQSRRRLGQSRRRNGHYRRRIGHLRRRIGQSRRRVGLSTHRASIGVQPPPAPPPPAPQPPPVLTPPPAPPPPRAPPVPALSCWQMSSGGSSVHAVSPLKLRRTRSGRRGRRAARACQRGGGAVPSNRGGSRGGRRQRPWLSTTSATGRAGRWLRDWGTFDTLDTARAQLSGRRGIGWTMSAPR